MNNRWVIDTSGGQLAAAIERAERAEARVAELEAAQAWRPVTEPPTEDEKDGVFCGVDRNPNVYPETAGKSLYRYSRRAMIDHKGLKFHFYDPKTRLYISSITHYYPIPADPAPEADAS